VRGARGAACRVRRDNRLLVPFQPACASVEAQARRPASACPQTQPRNDPAAAMRTRAGACTHTERPGMRDLLRSERTPVPGPPGARGPPAPTTDAVAASAAVAAAGCAAAGVRSLPAARRGGARSPSLSAERPRRTVRLSRAAPVRTRSRVFRLWHPLRTTRRPDRPSRSGRLLAVQPRYSPARA
jgi:hypothetical protein